MAEDNAGYIALKILLIVAVAVIVPVNETPAWKRNCEPCEGSSKEG